MYIISKLFGASSSRAASRFIGSAERNRMLSTGSANSSGVTNGEPDKLFSSIELEIKGHDPAVLKSYTKFLQMTCKHLEIQTGPVLVYPYTRWLQNLLRAKFAKKKNQVHYEIRTYMRKMTIFKVTGSTASCFLEYIERNIPEGVGMRVGYHELMMFPEMVRKSMKEKSTDGGVLSKN